MAINYVISYTFTPGTTISSSNVNTNFSDNANTWTGLEALTKSFSNLRVDATPTSTTDVAIKSYVDKLNSYRRPVLQWSSVTVVNLETGINGTAGQAQILFPDGTLRTDSTATRLNFDITRNCALSGTAQSGLRATLSEAVNTWYSLYAVKVTDSTANFVVVGDTLIPTQANYATLNTNFGTNGWVYLGLIANGDNSAATGDILKFTQSGNFTLFRNATTGNALGLSGPLLATQAVAGGALTWTYASGTAIGSAQIPSHIANGVIGVSIGTSDANIITVTDSAVAFNMWQLRGSTAAMCHKMPSTLADGIAATNVAGTSKKDIGLVGFWDSVLGVGANPIL